MPTNSNVARVEQSASGEAATDYPAQPEVCPVGRCKLNLDCCIELGGYQVQLAGDSGHLREQVDRLVTARYDSRGLNGIDDAFASTGQGDGHGKVTIAASVSHRVVGTLALGIDSPSGLLADSLYPQEINNLRDNGTRLCEVTRLAVDPHSTSLDMMAILFNVAFVLASGALNRTDLLAEVHPRHAGFYRRTMGYRVVGPERFCLRVGAPARLMHLRLAFADSLIREFAGTGMGYDRNLYRLFVPPEEQDLLLRQLTSPETGGW